MERIDVGVHAWKELIGGGGGVCIEGLMCVYAGRCSSPPIDCYS